MRRVSARHDRAARTFRGYAKCDTVSDVGTWRVSSDLLAQARFTVSPKAEVVAALSALLPPRDPAERAFHAAHHAAFEAMLASFPLRRDVLARSFRPRRGRPARLDGRLSLATRQPGRA